MKHAYSDTRVAELLAEYHRTGDERLRNEVVEHMRPLVRAVARKFAGREPVEDLESEGFVGLIRAVDRYTPGRGARFSTFAMHLVAGHIRHYLRDRGHLIRQPAWLQELNTRVQRASAELEQRLHRAPTVAEIAAACNLAEEGVEELLAARQVAQIARLDGSGSDEDDDFLEVDPEKIRSREYHTFELPVEDRIVLEGALEKLKELEQKVLYSFFFQDHNQSEIARSLGISCNYAGYVLRNGLKHLRERLSPEREAGVLDSLTGVYTETHFQRRLDEEIRRAQHYGQPVSVCCLRLPEDAPDSAVRAAGATLRFRTRKADIVARTGSHEFGVIFPDTGEVAAEVAARLAELLYTTIETPIHAASATYPDNGRTPEQLFAAAREAVRPDFAPPLLSSSDPKPLAAFGR